MDTIILTVAGAGALVFALIGAYALGRANAVSDAEIDAIAVGDTHWLICAECRASDPTHSEYFSGAD